MGNQWLALVATTVVVATCTLVHGQHQPAMVEVLLVPGTVVNNAVVQVPLRVRLSLPPGSRACVNVGTRSLEARTHAANSTNDNVSTSSSSVNEHSKDHAHPLTYHYHLTPLSGCTAANDNVQELVVSLAWASTPSWGTSLYNVPPIPLSGTVVQGASTLSGMGLDGGGNGVTCSQLRPPTVTSVVACLEAGQGRGAECVCAKGGGGRAGRVQRDLDFKLALSCLRAAVVCVLWCTCTLCAPRPDVRVLVWWVWVWVWVWGWVWGWGWVGVGLAWALWADPVDWLGHPVRTSQDLFSEIVVQVSSPLSPRLPPPGPRHHRVPTPAITSRLRTCASGYLSVSQPFG
jgi:hypothetical protein